MGHSPKIEPGPWTVTSTFIRKDGGKSENINKEIIKIKNESPISVSLLKCQFKKLK
jgi:hypothetical protein